MAAKMYDKFLIYCAEFNTIQAIACILDPRYKFSFVDFFFKKGYGADLLQFTDLKANFFHFLIFNECAAKASLCSSAGSPSNQRRGDLNRKEFSVANKAEDVTKVIWTYWICTSFVIIV